MDDLLTRLVLARLSRADARDLLAKDNRDELTSLRREAGAIGQLMAADRRLHLEGLLTGLEFAGAGASIRRAWLPSGGRSRTRGRPA